MKIKTKKELKENNLEPVKHRGQNFLISEEFLKKIIDSAKLKKGETVLEVGPGTGNLTEVLIETGVNIIAIEKDKNLADLLKLKMKNEKLKIVEADILKFDESAIAENYKIVANIPYYLTGQLIQKFLLSSNPPQKMILMVQKEVGERITANPPRTSYLSSLIQYLGQTKLLFGVGKENFWPVPKVDSVIIQITPQRIADPGQAEAFIGFLKKVYRQPRQTLFNNLRHGYQIPLEAITDTLKKLSLDKNIRPQNLDLEKLLQIFKSIMVY